MRVNIVCAGEAGAGRTYSLVVDDLDDRGQAAREGVVAVDDNDTADLDEAPVRTLNDCVAHCDGDLCSKSISRRIQKSRAVIARM